MSIKVCAVRWVTYPDHGQQCRHSCQHDLGRLDRNYLLRGIDYGYGDAQSTLYSLASALCVLLHGRRRL